MQRETPILADLCTLLVEHVYGELAARVFSVLARYGRQRQRDIIQASYLKKNQVNSGLIILTQQHLVFHAPAEASMMFYEVDWQQSYALVRYGTIPKLVEDRFGKKAVNVVSNVLRLGHTRIADLKDAYFPPPDDSDDDSDDEIVNGAGVKRSKTNGIHVNGTNPKSNGSVNHVPAELHEHEAPTNGVSKASKLNGVTKEVVDSTAKQSIEEKDEGTITSVNDLHDTIQLLMHHGWIIRAKEAQYLSFGDLHVVARQNVIDQHYGGVAPTGTKGKAELDEHIQGEKRRIRDAWLEVPQFASRKRKAAEADYGISNKRLKIDVGLSLSQGQPGYGSTSSLSSEDELVIRINPEKAAVAVRTEQLVHLVEQRLGFVTARIYRIMLQMLESNLPRCFEEHPDPPVTPKDGSPPPLPPIDPQFLVTARDVAKQTHNLDICEGLDPNAIAQITRNVHVKGKKKDSEGRYIGPFFLSNPVDPSKLSHDERVRIVDKHIQLLSEDPFHFVTWHSRAGFSQWHIEFEEIAKSLIQHEIENTVCSRKGNLGVKLVRALKKKGKLDERQTCNAMMMSANDIRGIVNDLTVQGFVQTQEIPKVERREAKHSFHLVWYDRQRAREKLLHDTYKGMVRIMQRIAFEREKIQPLLTKAERSDVVGNEAKYLSQAELTALKKWKDVQEKLLLQLFREDYLVATLRDFTGPLISA